MNQWINGSIELLLIHNAKNRSMIQSINRWIARSVMALVVWYVCSFVMKMIFTAQFFIPNPSSQQDQFQSGTAGFPENFGLTQQNSGGGGGPADSGFSQSFIPSQQGADVGFPPSIGGNDAANSAAPTVLPKHLIPPPDFVCEETFGHYGDHSNCSRFFVCVFGLPVVQECSKGLFYNPQLGLCDWPKNTDCPGKGGSIL